MDVRTGLAVALLGFALGASYALMWRGWRRRAARDLGLPALPGGLPEAALVYGPVSAVYLGTTIAGRWLDRVVAYGLGRRSPATLTVTETGIDVDRGPETALRIPAAAIRGVRTDRAGAGRAVRRAEYLIITWEHGEQSLDTAVRPRHREDLGELRRAVEPLAARQAEL